MSLHLRPVKDEIPVRRTQQHGPRLPRNPTEERAVAERGRCPAAVRHVVDIDIASAGYKDVIPAYGKRLCRQAEPLRPDSLSIPGKTEQAFARTYPDTPCIRRKSNGIQVRWKIDIRDAVRSGVNEIHRTVGYGGSETPRKGNVHCRIA